MVLVSQANTKRLQPVSGLLSALLVKYPDMQQLAQRAFITYLRSIYIQKDKEVFDVTKLPIDEYSASLGLPMTLKVKFLNQKEKRETESEKSTLIEPKIYHEKNESVIPKEELLVEDVKDNRGDKDFLLKDDAPDVEGNASEIGDIVYTPYLYIYIQSYDKDGRAIMKKIFYLHTSRINGKFFYIAALAHKVTCLRGNLHRF